MTRLDRITMQGFKSFSGKVTIPFPDGFTCVCGPNGSGKSNLIDALMFVLGTVSAKSIRAGKLENLIFNGGKNRTPADYCEVSIYLDNKDKKIPVEEDEVKITRRVTRSGVSIYKLNAHTVTRNKILDLISYAGLTAETYNIIMQGDVTRIIEMSNIQRREFIDEISGISEFDDKKEKALRELEHVETRVREGMLVVGEKERLVDRLKADKENAEKYLKLESEFRVAKGSLIKNRLDAALQKSEDLETRILQMSHEFEQFEKDFKDIDKECDQKDSLVQKLADEIIGKSRNYGVARQADAVQTEILRKKDKIDSNERDAMRVQSMMLLSENAAAQEVLKFGDQGVRGLFSSLIKVSSQYGVAIDVAAGRHKDDIVTDTDATAAACIQILRNRKIGRVRFLPLNKVHGTGRTLPGKEEGVIGFASDLVTFSREFAPAVELVLGSTLIVDTLDHARKIRGIRIVTLEGDLIEPSGAMTGGFYKRPKHMDSHADIEALEQENIRLDEEIQALQKKLEDVRSQEKEESEDVQRLQSQKQELERYLDEKRKGRKESYEKRLMLQGSVSKLKIEKARLEAVIDNLKIEFDEFKAMTEFLGDAEEILSEKVRRSLADIRALGPVNMKAIDEFSTINVEFSELKKKLTILLDEKASIMQTVTEVEKKRYEKFMGTFHEIRSNFQVIYHDLTNGEGSLRLEEENNIASGLIIQADPKGKKVVNLDAMSGGEKTLTSLSFLFAVMQHYSSPFYVLDEVDAALDKANTQKIADLIKNYSSKWQFIVITHNDLMISHADKVFGVSIEDGVSKVFGIAMPREA